MNRIKQIIEEYPFWKSNKDISQSIYVTLSGSYGYGTQRDDSDIDVRGVVVEKKQYLFGLESFEQFEDRQTDTVLFGLKKYISLCISANPGALELLGTNEDSIVFMNKAGRLLRDHADLFLSKRVIQSFGGYATAQFRRLSNALAHDYYDSLEQEHHLANLLKGTIDHFNSTYTPFDKQSIRIYCDEHEEKVLADIHLQGYPLKDFVGIYSEMNSIIRTYNKLNNRNRKKDEGSLYKHAMHLIRLLLMGTDILKGKGIITRRTDDLTLLMDIRNGKYNYDEIFKLSDECYKAFEEAAKHTILQDKADVDKVELLMDKVYGMYY